MGAIAVLGGIDVTRVNSPDRKGKATGAQRDCDALTQPAVATDLRGLGLEMEMNTSHKSKISRLKAALHWTWHASCLFAGRHDFGTLYWVNGPAACCKSRRLVRGMKK